MYKEQRSVSKQATTKTKCSQQPWGSDTEQMFIRGRFWWTSPDKNELMSLLARAGARFFPHKQHNTARAKEREGWEGGERKEEEEESAVCYKLG